jgi:putative peptide zinc metalloprotease protein
VSGGSGELEGMSSLWQDEVGPVSLHGQNAAQGVVERSPSNGGGADSSAAASARQGSADEFSAERMLRATVAVPGRGWRLGLYRLSGSLIQVGPSAAEVRHRELVAGVKAPIQGCRKVAFISRKGGVGKTTTCLLTGHTFASLRGDRVLALDGNPDAGTLGHRLRRETSATVSSLLADLDRISRYADIRGYTSQVLSRLEVVAGDNDPKITKALGETEFRRSGRPTS